MSRPERPEVTIRLRAKLPIVWVVLLLIIAFLLPNRLWNMMLIGLGGLFLIAYLWARSLAENLHAERDLRYGWVAVGDRLLEEFSLTNLGRYSAIWVEVIDESNVPGYQPAVVRSISSGKIRWQQEAVCNRRGQFRLGPWGLISADPFGIFEVEHRYPVSDEIIIHPPIDTSLPIPLPAGRSSGRVRAQQRALRATINAASIREYQAGDPLRWIHWPSTARRQKLSVRQFDLDASGDIWLLPDLDASIQLGDGAESTLEYSVLLAASLSARSLAENRPVGLAAYGDTPRLVLPGRGVGQQWRLLRALALVNADSQISLGRSLDDLSQMVSKGSAAVIITSRADIDWFPNLLKLTSFGVKCDVVLLERTSFGGQAPTRSMVSILREMGIDTHVVHQGELNTTPDEAERRGFWEFRTTATGRVIVVNRPSEETHRSRAWS